MKQMQALPDEITQARIAVLGELERSLAKSQQAWFGGDVAGLEEATAEQVRLQRALTVLGRRSGGWGEGDQGAAGRVTLRQVEERVLHLGRVQAAILKRAQRANRALACLRRGSAAGYDCRGCATGPGDEPGKEGKSWRD